MMNADIINRVKSCLTPNRGLGPTPQRAFFVIGDSHAEAIAPGLMAAVNGAASVAWISLSFWCGYVSERYIYDDMPSPYNHPVIEDPRLRNVCATINRAIDEALSEQMRSCDVAVLTHRSYAATGNGKLDAVKTPTVRASMIERYRSLQHVAIQKGARLLLLGDTPELPQRGTYCAASPALSSACNVPLATVRAHLWYEDQAYTQLVAEDDSNSTHYLKLSSLLCNGQTCGAYVAGTTTLLAADQDHLTWEAALSIWPELCAFVADAGLLGF